MKSERRQKLPFTEHSPCARYGSVPRVLQIFQHSILRRYSKKGTIHCILEIRNQSLIALLKIIQLVTNRTRIRTYLSGLPYPQPSTPVSPCRNHCQHPLSWFNLKAPLQSLPLAFILVTGARISSQLIFRELKVGAFELWWILNDLPEQIPYFLNFVIQEC